MKTVLIEVTQACIDGGDPGNPCNCAIQRAVQPKLRPGLSCKVGFMAGGYLLNIFAVENVTAFVVNSRRLPRNASNFAARFDDRFPVEPISFELELPEEVLR